MLIVCKW